MKSEITYNYGHISMQIFLDNLFIVCILQLMTDRQSLIVRRSILMELFKMDDNGKPIVFISGLFAGGWIWKDTISYFSKTKYRIIQQLEPLAAHGGKISDLR